MREDTLQILEFLPLENTSDKMFDPGPGAFEIPLPSGFVGAQAQDNERKVEVRQNHGMAVHGPIVPKRSQLIASDSERKANEVVFGFVLPYHGDTHDFSQPAPNGIGALTLITDQKVTGLTVSGPGVGPREERVLGGHKYWVMSFAAVPAGGADQVHAQRTALDRFQRAVVRGRRLGGAGVRRVRLRAPADVGRGRQARCRDRRPPRNGSAWSASARRCSASWSRWNGPRA